MDDVRQLMQVAIDKARTGIAAGQSPFGCAIAKDGRLVAVEHNTVLSATDITAHAEMNAIRSACGETGAIHLEGCIVASTCEPCPMCMAALHWARVAQVYFGATIADAQTAGFNELSVPARQLLTLGRSRVVLSDGILRDECRALFDLWRQGPSRRVY